MDATIFMDRAEVDALLMQLESGAITVEDIMDEARAAVLDVGELVNPPTTPDLLG